MGDGHAGDLSNKAVSALMIYGKISEERAARSYTSEYAGAHSDYSIGLVFRGIPYLLSIVRSSGIPSSRVGHRALRR